MVIRIGTRGWSYDHWQPELYPPGLPAAGRLGHCAATFAAAAFFLARRHYLADVAAAAVLTRRAAVGGSSPWRQLR